MKKFRIELLFVALGVVLVLCTAGQLCWNHAYADDCTQGCGTNTGICQGTNVTVQCNCRTQTSGITWSNNETKGSVQGSTKITFNSVFCRTVTPCVQGPLHRNVVCDMAIILPATCSNFMLGGECYDYNPGPAENYNVPSCGLDNCEED